ncbi:MAG TPA: hypothetical protein VMH00_12820 [Candidatus Limnocylindrales bacterium]|nr:hypothetical protein [Candidatus Limnocylindrales bacterium]
MWRGVTHQFGAVIAIRYCGAAKATYTEETKMAKPVKSGKKLGAGKKLEKKQTLQKRALLRAIV